MYKIKLFVFVLCFTFAQKVYAFEEGLLMGNGDGSEMNPPSVLDAAFFDTNVCLPDIAVFFSFLFLIWIAFAFICDVIDERKKKKG